MPINAGRRQKALMKKRRKDKEKRKKRQQASGRADYPQEVHWLKNAGKYPLQECLIGKGWEDLGIAQILVSRRQPSGRIAIGSFLVDLYCLGLKNTFSNADLTLSEYGRLKREVFLGIPSVLCPPGKVRRVILGAIDYAKTWGFEPHEDYELSRHVLENLPPDGGDDPVVFGYQGKPFFIAGPGDDFEAIVETLKRTAGEGNFDFLAPLAINEERSAGEGKWTARRERPPSDFTEKHPELATRLRRAGDDQDRNDKTKDELLSEYHSALQLKDVLEGLPGGLDEIEDDLRVWLTNWLLSLPFGLARQGFVLEAAHLGKQIADVHDPKSFLGDRAIILAEHGRGDEAIAQVDENLVRWPNDPWVAIRAGDAYAALKKYEKAELLFLRGTALAGDDNYAREGALQRLIPMLEEMGRTDEARALLAIERKRKKKDDITGDEPDDLQGGSFDPNSGPEIPAITPPAKMDRNAPCPCGSGKKYKKCCRKKKGWPFFSPRA